MPLLASVELKEFRNAEFAGSIRTLAQYGSGSTSWVTSLTALQPTEIDSWFSAPTARYACNADPRLIDAHRAAIRELLRTAIGVRYTFTGAQAGNTAMNS